ncbi:recombinase family protein [Streptomyces niveus]|uniref:recombinase family protein n=1 Tax=Streptomyces niveus TaxID=193462 RepID=UPI00342FB79C
MPGSHLLNLVDPIDDTYRQRTTSAASPRCHGSPSSCARPPPPTAGADGPAPRSRSLSRRTPRPPTSALGTPGARRSPRNSNRSSTLSPSTASRATRCSPKGSEPVSGSAPVQSRARARRQIKARTPHCQVIFTVYEMKRLGRDAAGRTALADHLTAHGLVLEMLPGPLPGMYDPSDPSGPGRLLFAFFASMAENERENSRKSTLEGLDTATRKGKHGGRPPVITDDMPHTVLRRHANGESVVQIQLDLIMPALAGPWDSQYGFHNYDRKIPIVATTLESGAVWDGLHLAGRGTLAELVENEQAAGAKRRRIGPGHRPPGAPTALAAACAAAGSLVSRSRSGLGRIIATTGSLTVIACEAPERPTVLGMPPISCGIRSSSIPAPSSPSR